MVWYCGKVLVKSLNFFNFFVFFYKFDTFGILNISSKGCPVILWSFINCTIDLNFSCRPCKLSQFSCYFMVYKGYPSSPTKWRIQKGILVSDMRNTPCGRKFGIMSKTEKFVAENNGNGHKSYVKRFWPSCKNLWQL